MLKPRLIDIFFVLCILTECRVIILMAKVSHHHAMRRYPDHHQQSQYQYHNNNNNNSATTRNDASQLSSTKQTKNSTGADTTKNHSSPGQRVSWVVKFDLYSLYSLGKSQKIMQKQNLPSSFYISLNLLLEWMRKKSQSS